MPTNTVSTKLAKRDSLKQHEPMDLFKAVAMDIGKEVACHIEIMYPEAVKACPSTFLLSVRNCTYNQIMAAIKVNGYEESVARLRFRDGFRRHLKAAWKKIRNENHD